MPNEQRRTIGGIMEANKGIGPGFDSLRVALAVAVVFRHCFPLTYGNTEAASSGILWTATLAIVPIFFILSGFLVTGSALRLSLGKFVLSRVLRIVPALAVDTLFTVLVIGALFTTLPLADYFFNWQTAAYLLNMIGEIHYYLPGVFEDNPLPGVVNGSLWTIPPELGCYVMMCGLMFFKLARDWRFVSVAAVAALVAIALVPMFEDSLPWIVVKVVGYQGAILVPEFLIGALMYLKRDKIPYSPLLFGICVLAIFGSGFVLPQAVYSQMPIATILAIPAYCYVMVFLGVTRLPLPWPFRRGDYSYGIYLYGFPIQQSIVAATGMVSPLLLFVTAMPFIFALAVLSWHFVERPTLKLRKGFSMAAKREALRQAEIEAAQRADEEAGHPFVDVDQSDAPSTNKTSL